MTGDDPRLKRVLKRYPKNAEFPDASIDVSAMGLAELLRACRSDDPNYLTRPKELDGFALARLSEIMGIEFDRGAFDYFLHSYIRAECLDDYFADPSVTSQPSPEEPPSKIPLPDGMRWRSARPQDGNEHYIAYEVREMAERRSEEA